MRAGNPLGCRAFDAARQPCASEDARSVPPAETVASSVRHGREPENDDHERPRT
jgi:hypothetical protein